MTATRINPRDRAAFAGPWYSLYMLERHITAAGRTFTAWTLA